VANAGSYPALTRAAIMAIPKSPPPVPRVVIQGFRTAAQYVVKHPVQVGVIAATTAAAALTFGAFAPEAATIDAAVVGADAAEASAGTVAATDIAVNTTGVGITNTLVAEGVSSEEAAAAGSEATQVTAAAGRSSLSSALRGIGSVARQAWSIGKPVLYGASIGTAAALAGKGIESGLVGIGGGIQYLLTGQPPSYQLGTYPPFVPTPSGPGAQATTPTPTATSSFFTSPAFGILLIGGLALIVYAASKR